MMCTRRVPRRIVRWKSSDVSEEHVAQLNEKPAWCTVSRTRLRWRGSSVSMPHSVISQQTERFVSTGVRTLNPPVRKKFNGNLSVLQLLRWTHAVNWYAETVTWIRTLLFCSNCPYKSCYPYLLLHDISEYPSFTDVCDGFRISLHWNPLRLAWIFFSPLILRDTMSVTCHTWIY
jgi:hypothetical protein